MFAKPTSSGQTVTADPPALELWTMTIDASVDHTNGAHISVSRNAETT
jgi:hypothetical protein